MSKNKESKNISIIFRNYLVLIFVAALILSLIVFNVLSEKISVKKAETLLATHVADVKKDIMDASDNDILSICQTVKKDYEDIIAIEYDEEYVEYYNEYLKVFELSGYGDELPYQLRTILYLRDLNNLSEINIIDENGIITCSTEEKYIGYDMSSGEQSTEFLVLLSDAEFYVQEYRPTSFDDTEYKKFAGAKLEKGFIQVGYNEEKFNSDLDSVIYGFTKNRHVGQTGFILIVKNDGTIVSSPYGEYNGENISYFEGLSLDFLDDCVEKEFFHGHLFEKPYSFFCDTVEGYYIFAVLPEEETAESMDEVTWVTDILQIITFIVMVAVVFHLVKRIIADNLDKVAVSLEKIAEGDLEVEVDAKGTKEFESLSVNINKTVAALKESAQKEVDRINAELEYAKNIQRSALPMLFPPFPDRTDFEIYATMDAAKEVGGDFFDFELLASNQLGFAIADVSGKGVPAALFMMRAKTLIKSYGIAGLSASEILTAVNREICSGNDADMFVTCWIGILNTDTGVVQYANAGHNPPLIRHKDGKFEYLKGARPGFVLGGMDGIKYKNYETLLDRGGEIFLYTDGVTEATNAGFELFGEERLKNSLDSLICCSCHEKCIELRKCIDDFVGDAPQFDDITMLSIKYTGSENKLTTEASMDNYDEIIRFIETELEKIDCPLADITKFNIAADEIISNIVKFAYGDATGYMSVIVNKVTDGNGASLTFQDRGIPFNPLDNPDPDTTLSAEDRGIGKLGLFMVKKLMDKVEYEYSYGNKLTITRYY